MFRRIAVAVGDDDGGTGLVVGEMAFAADSPGRAALKVVAVGTAVHGIDKAPSARTDIRGG